MYFKLKLKFPHLALVTSLLALSLFPATPSLARPRNVISSCRLYTSAGLVDRGRCIIRTRLEDNYIMVRVETPWQEDNEVDLMRLENNPSCTSWFYMVDSCRGDFWYGSNSGWSYVSAGETEEDGYIKFTYSLGTAYTVVYDGDFPRP